jgi:DNA-binding XRE family transcriptional regulator
MGMTSVGAYFRTLREKQGITRAWVAEQAETTETSLYRIESGKQTPGLELMLGIIHVLRGSVGDVRDLLRDEDAKEERGRKLAEQRLAAEYRQINDMVSNPDTAAIAHKLVHHPNFWTAVERAAQSLADDESQ